MQEFEMDLLIAQQRDQIDELNKINSRLRAQLSAGAYMDAIVRGRGVAIVSPSHLEALKDLELTVRSSKLGSAAFQDKLRAIDKALEA